MNTTPSWVPNHVHIKELETQLAAVRSSVICALNQLLDLKDLNTGVHSTRLADWAVRTGRQLGLDEDYLRDVEIAAILHDIGKIGTPDHILRKAGPLTDAERAVIQKHAEYGWAVLRGIPGLDRASLLVLHHHETYDGTGYPAGLRGEDIPVGARIVAVIDAFDAMISSRPYRQGLSVDEAIRRLEQASGTQFDPEVTPRFVRLAGEHASTVFEAGGIRVRSGRHPPSRREASVFTHRRP